MSEPQAPGATPDPSPSAVLEVDARNFEHEVITRSLEVPVLVHFTTSWSEPCRVLGPLLADEAGKRAGAVALARVDVERAPELAQVFRIQNVPTVVAIRDGKLIDGFQGALPADELTRFLDTLVGPAAPGAGRPTDPRTQAAELAGTGDVAGAIEVLETHLAATPEDGDAAVALAGLLADDQRVEDAQRVLDAVTGDALETDEAKAVAARLALSAGAGDLAALAATAAERPDDAGARLAYGQALVAAQRTEEGLAELLASVELDPRHDDAAARRTMLEVFEVLGAEDPLTIDFRYKLSLLLFC
jgi:putative thioredoxin